MIHDIILLICHDHLFLHVYISGVATWDSRVPWPSTSIFEPNKVHKFQFQTLGILLFTHLQKLYGPKLCYNFRTIYGGLSFYSNHTGEIVYSMLDLLKMSDT